MKFDIRFYDSVASTMDVARQALLENADEGTVIQAGEQKSGRGRRGHEWSSPKGNLYQSLILKPIVERACWGEMAFIIAVALADAVRPLLRNDQKLNLKWPNDVLIRNQKLAGILIEAGDDFVIVGTGVNIAHAPDGRSKLNDFTDIDVNTFRDILLSHIAFNYTEWQNEGFETIRIKWLASAYRKNDRIQVSLKNRVLEGIFENIDKSGALILRSDNGEKHNITSAEIINWDIKA